MRDACKAVAYEQIDQRYAALVVPLAEEAARAKAEYRRLLFKVMGFPEAAAAVASVLL